MAAVLHFPWETQVGHFVLIAALGGGRGVEHLAEEEGGREAGKEGRTDKGYSLFLGYLSFVFRLPVGRVWAVAQPLCSKTSADCEFKVQAVWKANKEGVRTVERSLNTDTRVLCWVEITHTNCIGQKSSREPLFFSPLCSSQRVLAVTGPTKITNVQAAAQQPTGRGSGIRWHIYKVLQVLQKKYIEEERGEFRKMPAYLGVLQRDRNTRDTHTHLGVLKKEDPSGHFTIKTAPPPLETHIVPVQRLKYTLGTESNRFAGCSQFSEVLERLPNEMGALSKPTWKQLPAPAPASGIKTHSL